MNNHHKGFNPRNRTKNRENGQQIKSKKTKNIWYNNRFIRCSTFEKLILNAKLHLQTFHSFWFIFFFSTESIPFTVFSRYALRFGYFILMRESIFKIEYNLFDAIHKFHWLSSSVSFDIVYVYVLNKMSISIIHRKIEINFELFACCFQNKNKKNNSSSVRSTFNSI